MVRGKKTKLMLSIERKYQRPLERVLTEMFNEKGLSKTAEELGVAKATVGYWLLSLDINVQRVVLSPGETMEIRRVTGPSAALNQRRDGR